MRLRLGTIGISIGVVLFALAVSAAAQKKPAVRAQVYVFAQGDDSGFVDKKSQELGDSVQDIQKQILKKKDWLALAQREEDAHIVVEVLDRGMVPTGQVETTSTGYVTKDGKTATGTTQTRERYDYVLTTVMRVGQYENRIEGRVSDQYILASWKAAADDVADEIEDWVKKNYDRLMSQTKR